MFTLNTHVFAFDSGRNNGVVAERPLSLKRVLVVLQSVCIYEGNIKKQ